MQTPPRGAFALVGQIDPKIENRVLGQIERRIKLKCPRAHLAMICLCSPSFPCLAVTLNPFDRVNAVIKVVARQLRVDDLAKPSISGVLASARYIVLVR